MIIKLVDKDHNHILTTSGTFTLRYDIDSAYTIIIEGKVFHILHEWQEYEPDQRVYIVSQPMV